MRKKGPNGESVREKELTLHKDSESSALLKRSITHVQMGGPSRSRAFLCVVVVGLGTQML